MSEAPNVDAAQDAGVEVSTSDTNSSRADAAGDVQTQDTQITIDAGVDAARADSNWRQIATTCGRIRDVAMISESEFFLACHDAGVLHVTDTDVTAWEGAVYPISQVEASNGEVRALACNDIYRLDGATWTREARVGTLSSCAMGLGAGGGGWFVGTRSFGGNGGFWQKTGSEWVVGNDTVRGFEDFIVFSPTDFVANTIGVSTGLNHQRLGTRYWETVSDWSFAIVSMWRIPETNGLYFIGGVGNGPGQMPGGLNRWYGGTPDRYVQEFYTSALNAVWGRSASEVYAAGDRGLLMRSNGDGQWQTIATNVDFNSEFVWGWHGQLVLASDSRIALVQL